MSQVEILPEFVRPKRVLGGDHPLIVLSKKQLKDLQLQTDSGNFWYIGRLEGGEYDYFLGETVQPLRPDIIHDLTERLSYSRRYLEQVHTAFGQTVEAVISGVINKNVITEEQRNLISRYFNPYRETSADVHPEVFTYTSAFNHVARDWPMINSLEHANALSSHDRDNLLSDLLSTGLGVLERESAYVHIQNATRKFRQLKPSTFLNFHITSNIYTSLQQERRMSEKSLKSFALEPHSLVYLPNLDQNIPKLGDVFVPTSWLWSALRKPIPALCSIIYASSLIRDDFYSHLRGSDMFAVRYFGSAEVPKKTNCDYES